MTNMDEILSALHEADKSGYVPTKLKIKTAQHDECGTTNSEPSTSSRVRIPHSSRFQKPEDTNGA
jgi:hypothetical protein